MQDITPKQAAMKTITDAVESEFPHDRALQQIHIARKLLSLEAEKSGMTLLQYAAKIAAKSRKTALG